MAETPVWKNSDTSHCDLTDEVIAEIWTQPRLASRGGIVGQRHDISAVTTRSDT
jgi:hypothetical protein